MKTLFINSITKSLTLPDKEELRKIPDVVFIAYSLQYKNLAERLIRELEKADKKITGLSQVLGCSKLKKKEPILLISSGKFHALNLLLQNNQVFILEEGKIKKLSETEINQLKKQKKACFLNFLEAENIGILVSLKPEQQNLKKAVNLKKQLEKKNKNSYIFIANDINLPELENFPDIQIWVNTACPGLILDSKKIINLEDLEKLQSITA